MATPLARRRRFLAGLPLLVMAACGASDDGLGTTLPTLPPTVVPTAGTTAPPTTLLPTTSPRPTAPTGGPNTLPPIPELTTVPGTPTTIATAATTTAPGATGPITYVDEPASGALRLGNKGPRVQAMQGQLVTVGYRIGVDGYFGRGTEAAVRAFQQAQAIEPADGIATDPTRQRLDQVAPAG